jgi:hypothetical protein
MELRIADLAKSPAQYEGQTVLLCGWASNGRERHFISEGKGDGHPTMAVAWTPDEPLDLEQPRCVVGIVTAGCARKPSANTVCVGADWLVEQTTEPAR